ncbi:MAG: hypothetical protein ACTSQ8_08025 [Candidatus Helarchaeota archaeon]
MTNERCKTCWRYSNIIKYLAEDGKIYRSDGCILLNQYGLKKCHWLKDSKMAQQFGLKKDIEFTYISRYKEDEKNGDN